MNKEEIIRSIEEKKIDFKSLDTNLRDDKDFAMAAVTVYANNLQYVSDRLRNDKEIVQEAVIRDGKNSNPYT